jgi:hypothetical protein
MSLKRGQPTIRYISDLTDVTELLAISVRRDRVCSPVCESKMSSCSVRLASQRKALSYG